MKKLVALSALVLSFASVAARADLVGSTVTGSLDNGAGNKYNPPSTTISATATEFSFTNIFTYTADFTSTGLTVTRSCATSSTPRQCATNQLANGFDESFTDSAFAGLTLTTLTNGLGLTNIDLTGTTLSFHGDNGTGTSTFGLTPTVPEPSSLVLLGTGILGAVGAVRRRIKA